MEAAGVVPGDESISSDSESRESGKVLHSVSECKESRQHKR
jgi:hypothetical protein